MFKLFERQPNWALKQLVQETDQPAVCFSIPHADIDDRFFPFLFLFKKDDFQINCVYYYSKILFQGIHVSFVFFCVQQFLKEILNELCVYNKRGTNQGTYELKPEYKKTAEDTGAD